MGKVALVPLRVLRRLVELDKNEDENLIVGIQLPNDNYLIDNETAGRECIEGKSFVIIDQHKPL